MVFAQLSVYRRRFYEFTAGDYAGAAVAHQDLLRAVLQHSSAEEVHIFLDTYASPNKVAADFAWEELRRDFPSKPVHFKQSLDLPMLSKRHSYVFCASGIDFGPLAHVRLQGDKLTFPIFSLIHAIDMPNMLMLYCSAILLGEPCDAIVTTSTAAEKTVRLLLEDAQELIESKTGARVTSSMKIATVPLGVDADLLRPRDQEFARDVLGLPKDRIIILYVGRFSEESKADLEPLLVAFRQILTDCPKAFLVFAGYDDDSKYGRLLEFKANRLGLGQSFRVIPNFPFCLKPLIYSASDLYVSPVDNVQEVFGLSILEAMACGLPVVASDWSGYRDLVLHDETGFLVPTMWNHDAAAQVSQTAPICFPSIPRHYLAQRTIVSVPELYGCLKSLIENRELRHRFGCNGRRRVTEKFCWPVVMDEYQLLWESMLDDTNDHHPDKRLAYKLNDYNRLFSHFATRCGLAGAKAGLENGFRSREELAETLAKSGVPRPLDIQVRKLLGISPSMSTAAHQLLDSGSPEGFDAVCWLVKRGYLQLSAR